MRILRYLSHRNLFTGAGAVDEDSFIQAFEDVKRVNIFSARALTDEINKIRETLSKSSNDWKVRIDALQMVRSLIIAGAASYDEFHSALRTLDSPFQVSVKDLRSQVSPHAPQHPKSSNIEVILPLSRSSARRASPSRTCRSS